MIYCITGPPRVGKSTVGRRVAARLEIACVPTDTIRLALATTASERDRSVRFPVSRYRSVVAEHGSSALLTVPVQELMQAYLDEAASCWPALASIVRFYAHRKESVVLEGCQLRPKLLGELEASLGTDQLRVLVLVRRKSQLIEQAIGAGDLEPGWMVDPTHSAALVTQYAQLIAALGDSYAGEAETNDWPIISVDRQFDTALADAEATLLGPDAHG